MKAKQYDTVMLAETVGRVPKGATGAVVEVYTTPHEAYDVEIVTDDGKTRGLLEAVLPEQIDVVSSASESVRFSAIRVEDDGTCAAVSFSDGTQVVVTPDRLYPPSR